MIHILNRLEINLEIGSIFTIGPPLKSVFFGSRMQSEKDILSTLIVTLTPTLTLSKIRKLYLGGNFSQEM